MPDRDGFLPAWRSPGGVLFWAGALATLGSAIAFYNFPGFFAAYWSLSSLFQTAGMIYPPLILAFAIYGIARALRADRKHQGRFGRFFLAYRMRSRTAKLLRVAFYAIFVFLIMATIGAITDALSPADRGSVAGDVILWVVVALLALVFRFAAARVESRVQGSRPQPASERGSIDVPDDAPTQYAPVVPDDAPPATLFRPASGHSVAE